MKRIVFVCVVLGLVSGVARSDSLVVPDGLLPEKPDTASNPVMKQYPTGADTARYYPVRAMNENRSGQATVNCGWNDQGRLVNCVVVEEMPKGYGFGKATATAFETFGRVDVEATKALPKVSETIKFRYNWLLGNQPVYE
ncbi:MAG: hypothetical protein QM645_11550 [Asticcacaulis sp.]